MNKKKELHVVLGANGQLGNSISTELLKQGKEVLGVNRSGRASSHPNVKVVTGDLTNGEKVKEICQGADVVYLCASPVYSRWSEEFPSLINGVISGLSQLNTKLVFADNLYMYGPTPTTLTENSPNKPLGPKGKVRAEIADLLLNAHQKGKIKVALARAADFYGPGVRMSMVGERVFSAALKKKSAQMIGSLDLPHAYTFIEDFAKAMVVLGNSEKSWGEIWHVPNQPATTSRQFLEILYRELEQETQVKAIPKTLEKVLSLFISDLKEIRETRYQRENPFLVDSSKYIQEFGDHSTPFQTGIQKTLEWYRQQ